MLRRQWIATLVVLATAAGVGLLVIDTTPTTYESDAVVAVLPTSGGNPDANPYLTSPQALSELASLTIQILESPQKKAALEAAGVPSYTLENEQSSSSRSAAIFVTVEGSSPDDAAANAAMVVRQTSAELEASRHCPLSPRTHRLPSSRSLSPRRVPRSPVPATRPESPLDSRCCSSA